jgi:hypothetical protein
MAARLRVTVTTPEEHDLVVSADQDVAGGRCRCRAASAPVVTARGA